jgi:2-oxoglutarate/2-oxoacid ferredoxin oxidoreductase subunit alpha
VVNKIKERIELERVVIKFAGDSGDGIQLAGTLFAETTANMSNDIATFPDFPSEIRAPQGTVAGVSGFQIHFGKSNIHSPGDYPDVLVAMNPAALMANLSHLKKDCIILLDKDSFKHRDNLKAGFTENPIEDDSLADYRVLSVSITSFTKSNLADLGLDNKTMDRCKNMFALGIMYWLFNQPMEQTIDFYMKKFAKTPALVEANIRTLEAGFNFGKSLQDETPSFKVTHAAKSSGIYRNMTGNQAIAWGFLAAAKKADRDLFLGTYPITPATDILHELTKHKWSGIKIFQAEDEIAGICASIGASYAGDIGITTTSGPGMALKTEALGLAVMTELPLVIVNVQRGGPSTGLPTKTEQSDLFQAIYGRNGESPLVVIAASTPSNCFEWAYESVRIAVEHVTPVILLSESYIANGAEPWKIKKIKDLPSIKIGAIPEKENWKPYKRDKDTLARKWVKPGMVGFEHRIGGLEKEDESGNVSYSALNHQRMCDLRKEKIDRVADFIPLQKYRGKDATKLLVVGWGGQFGILFGAVEEMRKEDKDIAFTHFNYIQPLPKNTAEIFEKFEQIVVCELNSGQFASYLRSQFPQFDFLQYNKIQGLPFTISELKNEFNQLLTNE